MNLVGRLGGGCLSIAEEGTGKDMIKTQCVHV